ncbi:MAG: LamG domain-containing protein [Desulfuromonadales bacterium]|nr:LamG domain-containing protein [Desulfuromonadales bacterium]
MRLGFSLVVLLVMVLLMDNAVPKCADAACVTPPSGLVSWWGGDNNALDIVGNNNGTLSGATYAPGKVSQAFSLNGTNAYVQVPDSPAFNFGAGDFSLSLWVNYAAVRGGSEWSIPNAFIGQHGGSGFGPNKWSFYSADNGLYFHISNPSPIFVGPVSFTPQTGQWYHLFLTRKGPTFSFYVNGILIDTLTNTTPIPDVETPLTIGQLENMGYFNGLIDEVDIFNRALTAEEIAAIYSAGNTGMCRPSVAPPSGLVAWWRAENSATDSKWINHGRLINGATFATGKVGQAFSFDGVDDYVDAGTNDIFNFNNGAGDFTIQAWINPATLERLGQSAATIAAKDTLSPFSGWSFYIYPDGRLGFGGAGVWEFTSAVGTITTGSWAHVVITRNGSAYKLYKDGAEVASVSHGNIETSAASLRIGSDFVGVNANGDWGDLRFNGLIDEVAIFNQALSVVDIASIYNAGSAGMSFIPDTTPNLFDFISQTGMPITTTIVSNSITVTGINYPATISISGGSYQINGGSWTSSAGTVNNGDSVTVRQTSSASNSRLTTAALNIGGVSGTFNVTTAASVDPNASGLVAWWKAENNAYDSVGGNNGTPKNGATYAAGRVGQAFSLDGSGGYVLVGDPVPASLQIQNEITLSAWIYVTQYPSGDGMTGLGLIAGSQKDGSAAGATIFLDGRSNPDSQTAPPGHIHFQIGDGASWHTTNTNSQVPLNQWVHIVATRKAGEDARIYYNGVPQPLTSVPWGGTISYNNAWFAIGQQKDVNRPYKGLIDDVKIYSRALSASDVSRLYGSVPDVFRFTAQSGMPLNTTIISNAITVTGISYPIAISITGGEYQVNGGAWSSSAGTVNDGDTVIARQTSSASNSTLTTATLTIGEASAAFNVTTAAAGDPNASGLVAWWKGENNSYDSVGGNHGTVTGSVTYGTGEYGTAFNISAAGDGGIIVPASAGLNPTEAITLSAWVKPASLPNAWPTIVRKIRNGDDVQYSLVLSSSNQLQCDIGSGTAVATGGFVPLNAWSHVACTYDGTNIRVYVNGVQAATGTGAAALAAGDKALGIGKLDGSAIRNFDGLIDEVKIFSRALTTNEIRFLSDQNLNFEADPAGTSGPSISGWNYEFFTMNDSGTRGSNPTADHELATTASRSFSGSKAVYSRIRTLGGVGNQDPDYHYATHLLTTNYLPEAGKILDAVTIWRSDIAYTTSSRWFYWFAIELSDGTNTHSVMLACRDWGLQEGCANDFQDTHDQTSTGTDGQTWYRHRIPVPANLDRSKLKITIHHTERSWDGTSAESSLYYDLLGEETVVIDQTPDTFSFIAQTGMPLGTSIVSNPIAVTGINYPTAISMSGGSYQVNGGPWTSSPGTVNTGDTVMVRQAASVSYSTLTVATLTIGGVSGTFSVTTASEANPNSNGLIAWWRGENNAYDSVGGNHGAQQGGTTYAAALAGQAFSFHGGSDSVNIPAFNMGNDWTIEGWFYPMGASDGIHHTFFSRSSGNQDGITINYLGSGHSAANQIGVAIGANGSWQLLSYSGTQYPPNSWYHVAFSKNGETYTLYVNGQVKNQQTIAGVSNDYQTRAINLGHWNYGVSLNGLIDEVQIYNRPLSPTEVSKLAGTLPDPFIFTPVSGAPLSSTVESGSIVVTGTSHPVSITVSGGEYQINGGAWTSIAGTVEPGATVKMRLTSSARYSSTSAATLTIGGVEGSFVVTTLADTEKPVVTSFALSTGESTAMTVGITSFIATDNDRVSGYLVTDSATPPAADNPGWLASAPTTVTLSWGGDNLLRAWARDPAGNVSDPLTATVHLKPVRRSPDVYYSSLQSACNEANPSDTIYILAVTLPEGLSLNLGKSITLSGGYGDGYGSQNGFSAIQGIVAVATGKLTVNRVEIR